MRGILRDTASVSLEDYTSVLKRMLGSGSCFQDLIYEDALCAKPGRHQSTGGLTVGCPRREGVRAEHWGARQILPF